MSEKTIALLGQPNSGKSTLFNGLTGSRQHVGNWPGKTVERKDGSFVHKDTTYKIIDLPGTYSLSANSDEEVVTRNYIASGQADVVCILADASQLNRSLFMLADYTGIRVPVVLLLNMMDVAKSQGKQIDTNGIAKSLGIPVVPLVAADKKQYGTFFRMLESIDKNASTLDEIPKMANEIPHLTRQPNAANHRLANGGTIQPTEAGVVNPQLPGRLCHQEFHLAHDPKD